MRTFCLKNQNSSVFYYIYWFSTVLVYIFQDIQLTDVFKKYNIFKLQNDFLMLYKKIVFFVTFYYLQFIHFSVYAASQNLRPDWTLWDCIFRCKKMREGSQGNQKGGKAAEPQHQRKSIRSWYPLIYIQVKNSSTMTSVSQSTKESLENSFFSVQSTKGVVRPVLKNLLRICSRFFYHYSEGAPPNLFTNLLTNSVFGLKSNLNNWLILKLKK